LDSLRDRIWRSLLEKEIQQKYDSALPDALPMPKRQYLYPKFDQQTWDQLVKSYVEALEVLRGQAVEEAESPPKRDPPWFRKNSTTGLIEEI
jgi:hypothetical protein